MNKKIRYTYLALSITSIALSLAGCKNKKQVVVVEEKPNYTLDNYNFKEIYKSSGAFLFDKYDEKHPENSKKIKFNVDKSIDSYNYLKLEFETDCDLVGWITYHSNEDLSKVNTEKFFVRAGDTKFTTFLDSFRQGAFGAFATKTINSVTFQSVDSEKQGKFTFKSLSISDREYYRERMYITDGTLKFGTSVHYGGSMEWLERVDIDVIEYIDNGGNVRIDKDIDPSLIDKSRLISTNVNVINIFDLGREVQPSYYLSVDKEHNGYDPKTPYAYESISGKVQYNPIQCGGVGDIENNIVTEPQVIDFEYKEDHIYFKTKGQDWMFVNDQAEGYIESNYHFGEDGLLVVDNSYTDFYQFANLNSANNPMCGQETPATYFVQPFNYFYCKTKTRTVFDPYMGHIGDGSIPIEDASATIPAQGTYYYALKSAQLKNKCDWMANVNDQKFGCGIFMPNADYYICSRGNTSTSYKTGVNSNYTDRFFDFGDSLVPSYAVSNYNYMNPQLRRRMIEFVPLEYQYAIYIGDVDEMDEVFDNAKANGLNNENLTMSENTWPKH